MVDLEVGKRRGLECPAGIPLFGKGAEHAFPGGDTIRNIRKRRSLMDVGKIGYPVKEFILHIVSVLAFTATI